MLELERIKDGFLNRYPDRIVTIDSHTQGEPTRLLIDGVGEISGDTMKEKRAFFEARNDHIRLLLTREPRGHRDMFTAAVTEPVSKRGQFGLIYMDAERYPYLCGHATIGAVTTLVEIGALDIENIENNDTVITVDTPSGPLEAHTRIRNGTVEAVAIDMVPSFVFAQGCEIEVSGFGRVVADLVCVGGFFAMVSSRSLGIKLVPSNGPQLISLGMAITEAANKQYKVFHPQRQEVNTVDVTELYDEDPETGNGISVVVYGKSHMDRSPCGTGTAAKMTLLHRQGKLGLNQRYISSSLLGTQFEGWITGTSPVGDLDGITARIQGSAQITGYNQFVLDDSDPFPKGFLL